MTLWEGLLVVLAGMGAGTINTIVGSGTLLTFPTLLLLGVPPVTANMSNTVGLVAGGLTGIYGYRTELVGARRDLVLLAPMTFLGSLLGAVLLLVLDPAAFKTIVPVLITLGVILVLASPKLSALTRHRQHEHHVSPEFSASTERPEVLERPESPQSHDEVMSEDSAGRRRLMQGGVFGAGIYGGYFGAAQGVLLIGIMSILSTLPLQRLNGYKNVLGTIANAVAAVVFIVVGHDRIDWLVAALIAVGALAGGAIGATVGRRLSPTVLRIVIAVIGVVAVAKVLTT